MFRLKRKVLIFILIIISQSLSAKIDLSKAKQCQNLMNWIYQDLTLKNLDSSYSRLTNKLLLGLYHAHQKTKNSYEFNKSLSKALNSIRNIDPDLKKYITKNKSLELSNILGQSSQTEPSNLGKVITQWRDLQKTSPELFKDLDSSYLLDEWDMLTLDLIEKSSELNFKDSHLKKEVMKLSLNLESSTHSILNKKDFNDINLKENIAQLHKELIASFNKNYQEVLDNYSNICSQNELALSLQGDKLTCPLVPTNSSFTTINDKLKELSKIIDASIITSKANELIPIEKIQYKTSRNRNASYCKRDPMLASMITIHHTGTSEKLSPRQINSMHLDNGTLEDPWYMIGYNYVISESYNGASRKSPKVIEGRPPNYRGAHAGGNTLPLTSEQIDFLSDKKIYCGNEHRGFDERPALSQLAENGSISGNFASFGVAVIGDYAAKTYKWNGVAYVPSSIHSSTKVKPPTPEMIDSLARLSCKIQKENPSVTKIVPHNYFKSTDCPGIIINFLDSVAKKASEYGCHFEVLISKDQGRRQ